MMFPKTISPHHPFEHIRWAFLPSECLPTVGWQTPRTLAGLSRRGGGVILAAKIDPLLPRAS